VIQERLSTFNFLLSNWNIIIRTRLEAFNTCQYRCTFTIHSWL